jgi:BASS family bile acid:Na+ symporter
MSFMAKNNLALSVSLTVSSTLLSLFFTPFNILFWGGLQESSSKVISSVTLDYADTMMTLMFVIVLPLILGGITKHFLPRISDISVSVFRKISPLLIATFFFIVIRKNAEGFLMYTPKVLPFVIGHNLVAILIGYLMGKAGKLNVQDTRTLMVEVAIQNSGLGLGLILTFFPSMIGAALVLAFWGVWHLVGGLGMVYTWKWLDRKKTPEELVALSA